MILESEKDWPIQLIKSYEVANENGFEGHDRTGFEGQY